MSNFTHIRITLDFKIHTFHSKTHFRTREKFVRILKNNRINRECRIEQRETMKAMSERKEERSMMMVMIIRETENKKDNN